MKDGQLSYIDLYHSGELEKRAAVLESRLAACDICPHCCRVNRWRQETGFCRSGVLPVVASVCAHHGEEPPLSGTKGSGTIFFGNCNMRCVYCQNSQISQTPETMQSKAISTTQLATEMLYLQNELCCHNINLVSPSHFVPQIVRAVYEAVPRGLKIPLVYNTGGYDSLSTIQLLDGIIDIYLPDIRYAHDEVAEKYSGVKGYVAVSRASIKEMYRQTGNLKMDEDGIAVKGLIIRHLILPGKLSGSESTLPWVAAELSPDVALSIMAQYYPAHRSSKFPEINRRIIAEEYDFVSGIIQELQMENGWMQELDAADHYRPDFLREGHPFQP